jgi:hypothetical protein
MSHSARGNAELASLMVTGPKIQPGRIGWLSDCGAEAADAGDAGDVQARTHCAHAMGSR